jgi:drug/metabolite transporter (DMT)-like permease
MFVGLGIAWGIPYLLIKIALEELSPAQLVLARTVLAALLLLPLALLRQEVAPVLRRWRPVLVFAAVEVAIPWLFLNRAEQVLPSSTTGLLIAAVPLAGLGIAFLTGRAERLGRQGWLGLALGIAGVAALVGLDVEGSDLLSVLEVGVVVIGYAVGPVILTRYLSDLPSRGVIAVAMVATAMAYLPIVALTGGFPTAWPSGRVIAAVVVLAVVCTVAAFLMLFGLVAELGPVRATTITYLNPAVAMLAGALVLSEPITAVKVVGLVLVLAGCYLITRRTTSSPVEAGLASTAAGLERQREGWTRES